MKKYIIFSFVILGILASACVKDDEFLTEKVKDRVTVLNAFESSDQVVNTILTGYYDMGELYFPNGSGLTRLPARIFSMVNTSWVQVRI